MTLIGVLAVSAFATLGIISNQEALNRFTDAKRREQRQVNADHRNMSALHVFSRLNKAGANNLPAIRVDPYIPQSGSCDDLRPLAGNGSGGLWELKNQNIAIKIPSVEELSAETFDKILGNSAQNPSGLNMTEANIKVIGIDCDPATYLIHGVYVESSTNVQNEGQSPRAVKALIAVDRPPESSCELRVFDSQGKNINQGQEVTSESMRLNLRCNHVVTEAKILTEEGELLAVANGSWPYTKANRIQAEKVDLIDATVPTKPGAYKLIARVGQVDSNPVEVRTNFSIKHNTTMSYGEIRQLCGVQHRVCHLLPENEYPSLYGGPFYHKPYYQDKNPELFICFRDGNYWAFDPKNQCRQVPGPIDVRGAEGCFAEGTMIHINPSEQKAIQDLSPGDQVWNPITGRLHRVKKVLRGYENSALVEIVSKQGRVVVTQNHPFVTENGLFQAQDLRVGQILLGGELGDVEILAINRLSPNSSEHPGAAPVWNLELEGDWTASEHVVLANGVPSGDQLLQTQSRSWVQIQDELLLDQRLFSADSR